MHEQGSRRLLLRIPEVMSTLGLGRTKVYELIAKGELPVIRVGRAGASPARHWKSGLKHGSNRIARSSHLSIETSIAYRRYSPFNYLLTARDMPADGFPFSMCYLRIRSLCTRV
ncbi:MAG TPA: AlpA family phage regulatory protein [Ktedonobacteraceae bacterium]|nr:AlpA family phage regulatory protein [Ktedonobacteraceae bacterium]